MPGVNPFIQSLADDALGVVVVSGLAVATGGLSLAQGYYFSPRRPEDVTIKGASDHVWELRASTRAQATTWPR